ncbi:MAG TPA: hypothetical protein VM716_11050 [Gemmatimonadales bacterium]|nr:hypothetical protein [Gemmatimonadales bacterium]
MSNAAVAVIAVLLALYLAGTLWDPNPIRRLAIFLLGCAWLFTGATLTVKRARTDLAAALTPGHWSLGGAAFVAWALLLAGFTWWLASRRRRRAPVVVVLVFVELALGFFLFESFALAVSEPGGWRILLVTLPLCLGPMALLLRWGIAQLRRAATTAGSAEKEARR